jgi:hypothetical protein
MANRRVCASGRITALSEKCSGEVIRLSHLSGIPTIRQLELRSLHRNLFFEFREISGRTRNSAEQIWSQTTKSGCVPTIGGFNR